MEGPEIQNSSRGSKNNIGTPLVNRKVCFISYNSRGFSESQQKVTTMLASPSIVGDKLPIVCNQENFILKANSYKILQTLPNFQFFINPATKEDMNTGRPKGGLFIAVPESIKGAVKDVSPGHWRLQAVIISSPSSKTLLINSYFPTDSRAETVNIQLQELGEVLDIIKNLIESHPCDAVVWAGDINADFSRNSAHVRLVKDTMEDINITSAWDKFDVDFTCCGDVGGVSRTSVLDHISYSEGLAGALSDAGVVHLVENRSDHSPIYAVFDSIVVKQDSSNAHKNVSKPSWKRSNDNEKKKYCCLLEDKLNNIDIPKSIHECRDVKCSSEVHKDEADKLMEKVLCTVQKTAEECLPCPKGTKGRSE